MSLPRFDPFLSFNFTLQVDGLVVGSFSEVSGIGSETEVEEYREGGVNEFTHKLPKTTKYGALVLRRGMTLIPTLYDWYRDVVNGKINRRTVIVALLNNQKAPAKTWTFRNAFPVKWQGPELKADGNAFAIESVELVHQGIVWLF